MAQNYRFAHRVRRKELEDHIHTEEDVNADVDDKQRLPWLHL
jgi:hypothetical protein